jgi:glycosyltransferase involved in cell wall biosynthesis
MNRPRRLAIAHLDTGLSLRGGQHQLLTLARSLAARGHRQLIACPETSSLISAARAEGFATFPLPDHDPGHLHGVVLLRRELAAFRADILHAHDGVGQTIAWLAGAGQGARRVVSRRVTFLPSRRLDYRLKYTYTCQAVIVVSEFVRRLVVESGVPAAKVELIPDGVEIPSALSDAEARRRVRARWKFRPADFVIGHVGAFTREKGQDIAAEAYGEVVKKIPQARLVLAGEGCERARQGLGAGAAAAGIRLFGPQENLSDFLWALDLYVMPSRSEGLGSSALLAMAHGLPVVAARVGGLPELVEEGRTGWLVEPESPPSLARAIVLAAGDRARLAAFGQNARRRAEDFSAGQMAARTEALYVRLLGEGAAPL